VCIILDNFNKRKLCALLEHYHNATILRFSLEAITANVNQTFTSVTLMMIIVVSLVCSQTTIFNPYENDSFNPSIHIKFVEWLDTINQFGNHIPDKRYWSFLSNF